MKSTNTYVIFEGNCRQAMEFYKKCLGGELYTSSYADMPKDAGSGDLPPEYKDWLIHARLTIGSIVIMASDTRPGWKVKQGDNFFINLNCENMQEVDKTFKALSEKGSVEMAPQQTFWAQGFAMLTDQFGIKWMLNLEKPGQKT